MLSFRDVSGGKELSLLQGTQQTGKRDNTLSRSPSAVPPERRFPPARPQRQDVDVAIACTAGPLTDRDAHEPHLFGGDLLGELGRGMLLAPHVRLELRLLRLLLRDRRPARDPWRRKISVTGCSARKHCAGGLR
ncbi:MAG TPA: hypothetical protein VLT58_11340 [Polyangia bacterium]|nr:hypothetical protein [Polyangia bacterium]